MINCELQITNYISLNQSSTLNLERLKEKVTTLEAEKEKLSKSKKEDELFFKSEIENLQTKFNQYKINIHEDQIRFNDQFINSKLKIEEYECKIIMIKPLFFFFLKLC